jgi:hypothetical protein
MSDVYTLTILHTDGSATVETSPRSPSLERLQAAVGGFIQVIPRLTTYNDRPVSHAWMNEEGRLEALPPNPQATRLWAQNLRVPPQAILVIVGDVAIVQRDRENRS